MLLLVPHARPHTLPTASCPPPKAYHLPLPARSSSATIASAGPRHLCSSPILLALVQPPRSPHHPHHRPPSPVRRVLRPLRHNYPHPPSRPQMNLPTRHTTPPYQSRSQSRNLRPGKNRNRNRNPSLSLSLSLLESLLRSLLQCSPLLQTPTNSIHPGPRRHLGPNCLFRPCPSHRRQSGLRALRNLRRHCFRMTTSSGTWTFRQETDLHRCVLSFFVP